MCGSAFFIEESTFLDEAKDFSINYQPSFAPESAKYDFSSCNVLEKENYYLKEDKAVSVYRFRCTGIDQSD